MSTALARLRDVFKDVLLVKTTTGMEPTPRAIELVRRIRDVTDLLEGRGGVLEKPFEPITSHTRWRIMASDGISRVVLPELMAIASEEAPNMRFIVQPADVRRLSEYLRDGDFDLAMAFVRTPPSELRQTMLYPQPLVCIARKDHPNLNGQITLKQFSELPHARWGAQPVAHATMEAMIDEALEHLGQSRKVAMTVSSLTLLPGIVARSNLIASIPKELANSACETLPIQLLPMPIKVPSVDVTMLWHERIHHDPGHKWLRNTLRAIGQKLSAREEISF